MTIDSKIWNEKLLYDINKKSGEIDKYEYFMGEEIIPSDQRREIEQAKFTYSPIGKALEKQIKTIEDQGSSWFNLMNLLKKILIFTEIVYHLKNKTIYLMNLLKKRLLKSGI